MTSIGGVMLASLVPKNGEEEPTSSPADDFEPSVDQSVDLLIDEAGGSVEGTSESDIVQIALDDTDAGSHYLTSGGGAGFELNLDTDNEVHETNINTGAGDDHIIVDSGGAITINTGDGNDTVDASGMQSGLIYAGQGDVIQGSEVTNGSYPTVGVSMEGGVFQGGMAAELAEAHGSQTGSILSGGGGNDILLAYGGDVLMSGGEGDDFLSGRANSDEYGGYTRNANVENYTNESEDTLWGGEGNDILELSNGDIGYGGSGADAFEIVHSSNREIDAATVADFTPGEDRVLIEVGGGDPWDYTDSSYDLSDRVVVDEADGNTAILVDGEIVAQISGATGLKIGIPNISSTGAEIVEVDQEPQSGETNDEVDFDVVLRVFHVRHS